MWEISTTEAGIVIEVKFGVYRTDFIPMTVVPSGRARLSRQAIIFMPVPTPPSVRRVRSRYRASAGNQVPSVGTL